MKRITVSVDDETHRLAKMKAAQKGTTVSAMVGEYLRSLTAGVEESPHASEKTLSEIISDIRARGGRISVSDNVSREELYDRDALR